MNIQSRREFLKNAGKLAVAASVASVIPMSAIAEEKTASHPYPYVELDPAAAEKVAYEGYFENGCCYGVAKGLLTELQAKVMNLNNIQNALCANELDFAIMEDRPDDIRLRSEMFFQGRLVLVMPNTHELSERAHISVRDIQGQRVLLRESGSNNRRLQEEIFERNAISIDPVFESYSTEAILSAVSQGIGISLVPEYLARTWIHSGLLVSKPLIDEPMARKNYIVWHREKHLTPQIHETMKICHRVVMRLCERKEEQV